MSFCSTQRPKTLADLRDVCLGRWYEAISGLGYIYSNLRCFHARQRTHRR